MENQQRILVKYGGNAMTNKSLQSQVISTLVELKRAGYQVIIVHGGGPFIADQLEKDGIESEFIEGHRKTTKAAMASVEMVLKGKVNATLVGLFNKQNSAALGISGKDAQIIQASRRYHERTDENGHTEKISLGEVGDVTLVKTEFLESVLDQDITPVIACVASDESGDDLNINADMMAGNIAGEMEVDYYLILTDIDGLRKDIEDPTSHISKITTNLVKNLFGSSIKGGMIPKIESCLIALEKGAHEAIIINGTKPELIKDKILDKKHVGTSIVS